MAHQPGLSEFGNWQSSETSYTQYFEEKRKQRTSATLSKRKDLPKEGGDVRRSPAPARVEGLAHTSQPKPHHQRHAEQRNYGDNQKIDSKMSGGGQSPLRPDYTGKSGRSPMNSERRIPREGVPGKRRNPGGGYAAQQHDMDVIVPPFPNSDEMDQAAAEKYTGVFDIVAQRTPYTPNHNSQKQDDKQKKHDGVWACLLHCLCGGSTSKRIE